jgi:teichuronic acid biosynthesis glycosyltransferase TuaG
VISANPKVSVIMPAYNAEMTIMESITSVINQTYCDWELLVVNDGSKDNSANIVRSFREKDSRVFLVDLPRNGGLPNARNEGCKVARGEFIAFLDSDDLWENEKLEIQIEFHQTHPEIEISHTSFQAFDGRGIIRRPWKNLIEWRRHKRGMLYPSICYRNLIGVLTVMAKRETLQRVGFFDSSLWTLEDQDLWVRIARQGKEFGYIDKDLALYRRSEGGISKRIGKYKRAYKHFIKKLIMAGDVDDQMLWRTYYRNFGTVHLKKNEFRLSRLYFSKSIALVPFDFIALTTYSYMTYGLLMEVSKRLTK